MWRVIDFFATVIDRFVFAIKNFKKNPIDSLGVLLPFAMNLIGFVATMVPYSAFLLNGCYADQIEILNAKGENSLSRIKEIATPYEADLDAIYLIVTKVVVLLLVGQLIVIMIAYFKRESKVLKVLMKIDMIIFAMAHVLRLVINALVDSLGLLSENEQEKILELTKGKLPLIYETIMTTLVITIIVAVLFGMTLLLIAKCRWMVGYCVAALLITYVVYPLLLMLLVEAIYLAFILLMVAIIGSIFLFLFAEMVATGGPVQINVSLEYGCQLYKVRGWTSDSIEFFDGEEYSWICSLEDLRRGSVCIYDTVSRRNIGMFEIPWK